jgi:hypothetical protein
MAEKPDPLAPPSDQELLDQIKADTAEQFKDQPRPSK